MAKLTIDEALKGLARGAAKFGRSAAALAVARWNGIAPKEQEPYGKGMGGSPGYGEVGVENDSDAPMRLQRKKEALEKALAMCGDPEIKALIDSVDRELAAMPAGDKDGRQEKDSTTGGQSSAAMNSKCPACGHEDEAEWDGRCAGCGVENEAPMGYDSAQKTTTAQPKKENACQGGCLEWTEKGVCKKCGGKWDEALKQNDYDFEDKTGAGMNVRANSAEEAWGVLANALGVPVEEAKKAATLKNADYHANTCQCGHQKDEHKLGSSGAGECTSCVGCAAYRHQGQRGNADDKKVCPNCDQWAYPSKSKGYYDCSSECAQRGFAPKAPVPKENAAGRECPSCGSANTKPWGSGDPSMKDSLVCQDCKRTFYDTDSGLAPERENADVQAHGGEEAGKSGGTVTVVNAPDKCAVCEHSKALHEGEYGCEGPWRDNPTGCGCSKFEGGARKNSKGQTHAEFAKSKANPGCSAQSINFGGGCFACGWEPAEYGGLKNAQGCDGCGRDVYADKVHVAGKDQQLCTQCCDKAKANGTFQGWAKNGLSNATYSEVLEAARAMKAEGKNGTTAYKPLKEKFPDVNEEGILHAIDKVWPPRSNAGHLGPESWDAADLNERAAWLEEAGLDIELARFPWTELSMDAHKQMGRVLDKPASINNAAEGDHVAYYTESDGTMCKCGGKTAKVDSGNKCKNCGASVDTTRMKFSNGGSEGDLEEIARHAEGIEHEVQELANASGDCPDCKGALADPKSVGDAYGGGHHETRERGHGGQRHFEVNVDGAWEPYCASYQNARENAGTVHYTFGDGTEREAACGAAVSFGDKHAALKDVTCPKCLEDLSGKKQNRTVENSDPAKDWSTMSLAWKQDFLDNNNLGAKWATQDWNTLPPNVRRAAEAGMQQELGNADIGRSEIGEEIAHHERDKGMEPAQAAAAAYSEAGAGRKNGLDAGASKYGSAK